MNLLYRYGGVILVLIGALMLIIPQFQQTMTNTILGTGLTVIVVGVLAMIFLGKLEK